MDFLGTAPQRSGGLCSAHIPQLFLSFKLHPKLHSQRHQQSFTAYGVGASFYVSQPRLPAPEISAAILYQGDSHWTIPPLVQDQATNLISIVISC